MPDLFGVDIAKAINDALGKHLVDLTLTSWTPGTRTSTARTSGTNPTSTTATGKGIIEDYDSNQIDGTRVHVGDRKILILGKSIDPLVPKPNDQITIEGSTYRVMRVKRDPAAATYSCQVRG